MSKSEVIIPVRRHVKQFLIAEYGPEPIHIHQNTMLGKTLSLALDKLPYRQGHIKKQAASRDSIRLILPTSLKHRSMTPKSEQALAEFFDKYFLQQFLFFVKGQVAITGNEHAAICGFCQLYELDADSYDKETARAAWKRYKESLYKKIADQSALTLSTPTHAARNPD